MNFKIFRTYLVFILFFQFGETMSAQQSDQVLLEEKRNALKNEILKIKTFIDNTRKKESTISNQVQDLIIKIKTREKIVQNMDKELDNINTNIKKNTRKIDNLTAELKKLKRDYSDMIYKTYKNKDSDNQLLFLLSAESFYQSYLRFQYLKQYTSYRKKQGEKIQENMVKLKVLNDSLGIKKTFKENLLVEKEKEQAALEAEKLNQMELVKKFQKQKKEYLSQVQQKQEEERQLTNQIENLIKEAIRKSALSNTAPTKPSEKANVSKNEFALAPEAQVLAEQFFANKGKLPWPVDKGLVTVEFGKQPDPMDGTLIIESSGVRIATAENQKCRSIFDGKVMAIQKNPQNGILSVLIQHGNYITVYANLRSVSVSKGDLVKTKQNLGTIHTDQVTGKTILKFQIWQNDQKMNPSVWIDSM